MVRVNHFVTDRLDLLLNIDHDLNRTNSFNKKSFVYFVYVKIYVERL